MWIIIMCVYDVLGFLLDEGTEHFSFFVHDMVDFVVFFEFIF